MKEAHGLAVPIASQPWNKQHVRLVFDLGQFRVCFQFFLISQTDSLLSTRRLMISPRTQNSLVNYYVIIRQRPAAYSTNLRNSQGIFCIRYPTDKTVSSQDTVRVNIINISIIKKWMFWSDVHALKQGRQNLAWWSYRVI